MNGGSEAVRRSALDRFLRTHAGVDRSALRPASSDASFRSYWRLVVASGASRILMDAPPEREPLGPFLDIGLRLRRAGIRAPEVHAVDLEHGFALLEDFGDQHYLSRLDPGSVDALYGAALDTLLRIQTVADPSGLPPYDRQRLTDELMLFPTWFLERHLGQVLAAADRDRLAALFERLVDCAAEQPQCFVHRDFHSRNLMLLPDHGTGVLDFQDALRGPITYDLVSLLKDCYVVWPPAQVYAWAEGHRRALVARGRVEVGPTRWRRWFDWLGVQRHLKVLGIFCRLWYRDGKPAYLQDLPRVLDYVLSTTSRYGELAQFGRWLEDRTRGRPLTAPRETTAPGQRPPQ